MKEHLVAWIVTGVGVTVFLMIVGAFIKGNEFVILIDDRNRYSLSRLQLSLWTILLVSAFLVVAFTQRTIDIYLVPEVWALMGIMVGSAAGSVIVKGTKAGMKPDEVDTGVKNAIKAMGTQKDSMLGVLFVAEKPNLGDIFKAEEAVDQDYVDIGKVQMFFFTLAVITGYVAALLAVVDLKVKPEGLVLAENYAAYFPTLSTSMVTLLGISHAGYLTVKAAPHTKTE